MGLTLSFSVLQRPPLTRPPKRAPGFLGETPARMPVRPMCLDNGALVYEIVSQYATKGQHVGAFSFRQGFPDSRLP